MSGEVNGDDDLILGWCKDPFGTHELRWITRGTPSSLVRDAQVEAKDPPPPDRQPTRPFVPVDTIFGSDDPRRAGQSECGSGIDYGTVAMDANVVFDSSMTPNGVAPSDGRPLSSWPTSFDIKMRKRARKQRRSERWQRWFGGNRPDGAHNPGSVTLRHIGDQWPPCHTGQMSTSEFTPAFWGLEFGLSLFVLLLIWWWVVRHMPKGIVKRLQRSGHVKVRFVLPPGGLLEPGTTRKHCARLAREHL